MDLYYADIINLSIGIKKDISQIKDAVAYAEEQGVLVVCAAGNDGDSEELYYPAAYESVVCVGSHDKNKQVSDFSQKNETVDILAPGEDIWLASRNGKTYGTRGTSFATGYVSAALAIEWKHNPAQTPGEVRKALLDEAEVVNDWKVLRQNGDTLSAAGE